MKVLELFEALDSDVKYRVTREKAQRFSTTASVGGRDVVFDAHHDADENFWHIEFGELVDKDTKTYSATGSGSALQVGAFVRASFEEFLQRYTPAEFEFTAETDTRAKIYKRVVDKVAHKYSGTAHPIGPETEFRYVLKKEKKNIDPGAFSFRLR
jgi:hypothetical protein